MADVVLQISVELLQRVAEQNLTTLLSRAHAEGVTLRGSYSATSLSKHLPDIAFLRAPSENPYENSFSFNMSYKTPLRTLLQSCVQNLRTLSQKPS